MGDRTIFTRPAKGERVHVARSSVRVQMVLPSLYRIEHTPLLSCNMDSVNPFAEVVGLPLPDRYLQCVGRLVIFVMNSDITLMRMHAHGSIGLWKPVLVLELRNIPRHVTNMHAHNAAPFA